MILLAFVVLPRRSSLLPHPTPFVQICADSRYRKNPCKPWCGSLKVTTHIAHHTHGACTMIATVCTTAAESILAIDLGKYKSVACISVPGQPERFHSFATSPQELVR